MYDLLYVYFQNIFIGMTDTPLTADGVLEARSAGKLMAEMRIEIDEVYTSLLRRSTKTVWLCMQVLLYIYLIIHFSLYFILNFFLNFI